jgi:hypothetical protein
VSSSDEELAAFLKAGCDEDEYYLRTLHAGVPTMRVPPVLLAVRTHGLTAFAWVGDGTNAAQLGPRISVSEALLLVAFQGARWVPGSAATLDDGILRITHCGCNAVYRLGKRDVCSLSYSAEWPD